MPRWRVVFPMRQLRRIDHAEASPMVILPWRVSGARLHLPRDLEIAYAVGRMGVVTTADVYRLWYGSPHTARFGFGRLLRLGLLRTFPRPDQLAPAWFALTPRGLDWVAEQAGCDERELRAVCGIRRMNLQAIGTRNRLWTSLVLACRSHPSVQLACVQPEWELRRQRTDGLELVPDAIISMESKPVTDRRSCAWMLEMDGGTQRSSVLKAKAARYAAFRAVPHLYGHADWRVLLLVPSERRARMAAAAFTSGGAGAFSFVAIARSLGEGRAFSPSLWPCLELTHSPQARPSASLVDGITAPNSKADQQGRSEVDRGFPSESGAITP
ncbi:MAG: replication-relaxation family protein [Phycisphaerae bacterium]|nr:replication-relaxation family protein [Phycisphaerae bacterium]